MKIGIIYTAFNTQQYLGKSLESWIKVREIGLNGHDFRIAAISVPFEKFQDVKNDNTPEELELLRVNAKIDYVFSDSTPIKETEARKIAAKFLVDSGVDILWQVDSDEFYTEEEISKIIKFIERQPFIAAFQLCLKNYVFSENLCLEQPFSPMRIHRVNPANCRFEGFYDDNNVYYDNEGTKVKDIQLATFCVPQFVAWVKHLTWLSNDRSKKKIDYQTARGWECSYAWDETTNSVIFNKDFFSRRGILPPKIISA